MEMMKLTETAQLMLVDIIHVYMMQWESLTLVEIHICHVRVSQLSCLIEYCSRAELYEFGSHLKHI